MISKASCWGCPHIAGLFSFSISYRGPAASAYPLMYCLYYWAIPRNLLSSVVFLGTSAFLIFSTFRGSGLIPFLPTRCPTNLSSVWNHWHFDGLSFKFAFLIFSSTALMCLLYSVRLLEYIITSSKYTCTNFPMYCLRTLFMSLWKVADALFSPKGITLN